MVYPQPSKEPIPPKEGLLISRPGAAAAFKAAIAPDKYLNSRGVDKGGWDPILMAAGVWTLAFNFVAAVRVAVKWRDYMFTGIPSTIEFTLWFFASTALGLGAAGVGKLRLRGWLLVFAVLALASIGWWLFLPYLLEWLNSVLPLARFDSAGLDLSRIA